MINPKYIAVVVICLIGQGCFTVGIIESDGGLKFTQRHALIVAQAIRWGSYSGGAFGGPKAREVTSSGIRLVAGGMVFRGVQLTGAQKWEKVPEKESFIYWHQIKRVRIRYFTLVNVLCAFLFLHVFPSYYIMDLEDEEGRILFRILPLGQHWRNLIPCWLFTSSYNYCRHIARAIMFLSKSSGGNDQGKYGYRHPYRE